MEITLLNSHNSKALMAKNHFMLWIKMSYKVKQCTVTPNQEKSGSKITAKCVT